MEPLREFPPFRTSWMYPKNSILQPIFSKYFLELYQKGIIQKMREEFFVKPICDQHRSYDSVNFTFVQVLFMILASGSIMAIFVSIYEKFQNYVNSVAILY